MTILRGFPNKEHIIIKYIYTAFTTSHHSSRLFTQPVCKIKRNSMVHNVQTLCVEQGEIKSWRDEKNTFLQKTTTSNIKQKKTQRPQIKLPRVSCGVLSFLLHCSISLTPLSPCKQEDKN